VNTFGKRSVIQVPMLSVINATKVTSSHLSRRIKRNWRSVMA